MRRIYRSTILVTLLLSDYLHTLLYVVSIEEIFTVLRYILLTVTYETPSMRMRATDMIGTNREIFYCLPTMHVMKHMNAADKIFHD